MIREGGWMRTSLIALVSSLALAAPATAATRNFGITDFTKVRVSGPYKVSLATGVAPFARASGSAAALDRVAVEVRGDTLVVQSSPSWGSYPDSDPGPIEVTVGTHDLSNASLIGSGSLAVDRVKSQKFVLTIQGSGSSDIAHIAADQLNVSLEGTANARLAGQAGKVIALVRGVSTLDAAELATPSADVDADGAATIDANVTDMARVSAWGPATVRLSGRPTCALKVQGSTTVSGCRSTQ
jgi:hypothetical protein